LSDTSQIGKKGTRFVLVPLGLTVVVLGVTVALVWKRSARDERRGTTHSGGLTLAEQVLARSRPLLEKRQYAAGISLMQTYVNTHRDDVEVRPILAEAQMKSGRYDQAERTIDQVLLRAPRMSRALWTKGLLVRRRGREAVSFFRKAAESPDASPEIWSGFALELMESGQDEAAEDYLRRAHEAGLTDARTLAPLGELALRGSRFGEAERLLAEALKTAPRDARTWGMLSEAQIRSGKGREAGETLRRGVEACPEEPALVLQAARYHHKIGNHEEAKEYLRRAESILGDDQRIEDLKVQMKSSETEAGGERTDVRSPGTQRVGPSGGN